MQSLYSYTFSDVHFYNTNTKINSANKILTKNILGILKFINSTHKFIRILQQLKAKKLNRKLQQSFGINSGQL